MKKVSIVVPVYNVERYLERCVKSLLNQTYKNVEIILVDDGSTDSSPQLCKSLTKLHSNIKCIHKNNNGLGMARNTGIDIATGDFVIFIDSDDWCDQNLIEKLIDYSEKYSASTVISGLKRVDSIGTVKKIENHYEEECFRGEQVKRNFLPRIIGRSPQKRDSFAVSACAVLYSLTLIRENKLRFESEREYMAEDLLFNIDYFTVADSVCVAPLYGYNYFMNTGTLSTKYRPGRTEKYIKLYYMQKEKLEKAGIFQECELRLCCQYFLRIRNCIKQENTKVSGLTRKQAQRNIKEICKESLYQDLIKKYPISQLGIKRMFFLYAVKFRFSVILYFLSSRM